MELLPENAACHTCGRPAVIETENELLCEECMHQIGSCCGEWHDTTEEKAKSAKESDATLR